MPDYPIDDIFVFNRLVVVGNTGLTIFRWIKFRLCRCYCSFPLVGRRRRESHSFDRYYVQCALFINGDCALLYATTRNSSVLVGRGLPVSALSFQLTTVIRLIVAVFIEKRTLLCGRLVFYVIGGRSQSYTVLVISSNGYPSCYGAQEC